MVGICLAHLQRPLGLEIADVHRDDIGVLVDDDARNQLGVRVLRWAVVHTYLMVGIGVRQTGSGPVAAG